MYLMAFQPAHILPRPSAPGFKLRDKLAPQRLNLRLDLLLLYALVLELVLQFQTPDFNFAFAVVLEDGLVGGALVEGFCGVGGVAGVGVVAWTEEGHVALDIAGGAGAAGGSEADV